MNVGGFWTTSPRGCRKWTHACVAVPFALALSLPNLEKTGLEKSAPEGVCFLAVLCTEYARYSRHSKALSNAAHIYGKTQYIILM